MKTQYGRPRPAGTFSDLVEEMPSVEFSKITRSTIPLLAWWTTDSGLRELLGLLALGPPNLASFEYSVRAGCEGCGGRGKASFTDLMIEADDYVVAIEAKHTEALYQTVKSWFGEEPSENKQRVLKHWLSCCLGLSVPADSVGAVVYQMVHRAASARITAGKRTSHVVHLLFGSAHVDDYVSASKRAASLVSPNREIGFSVVNVPTEPGADYADVSRALALDGPDRLREAILVGADLFKFGAPDLRLGGTGL
jgi:hypothetical protein